MRKALFLTITTLLLLLLAALAGLYWAMQNQYGVNIVNQLFARYSKTPVSISSIRYHYPNQLSVTDVELHPEQQHPINIDNIDIWLDLSSLLSEQQQLESVLINGLSLQDGLPDLPWPNTIKVKQLSISNLDFSDDSFIARDASIQIKNPQFVAQGPIPFGTIQFSAEQIYWQGEAFDSVLLDADYKQQNSTIYGLSFRWRDGEFSGQAEQYPHGWSLINVTINQLRLAASPLNTLEQNKWQAITKHISHINSLDLLDSSISLNNIQLTNANLSIENLTFPFNLWQQSEGYISLNAESIGYLNQQWLDPVFQLYLHNNSVQLVEGSVEFQQGLLQASGLFQPNNWQLSHLSLSGIKWISEQLDDFDLISNNISNIKNLSVKKLAIKHAQIIQLAQKPNWQLTGLEVKGDNLQLVKDGEIALWNGKLDIKANNASYDQLYSSLPVMSMTSDKGIWQLNDLFIPLRDGLLEAKGHYQLDKVSRPWKIESTGYGVPTNVYQYWTDLPFKLEGTVDYQLTANGLAGDPLNFQHSLTGQLSASLRDAILVHQTGESDIVSQPIDIAELKIIADRGRVKIANQQIKGVGVAGFLSGQYDLVDKRNNHLQLELSEKCTRTHYDLLNNSTDTLTTCEQ